MPAGACSHCMPADDDPGQICTRQTISHGPCLRLAYQWSDPKLKQCSGCPPPPGVEPVLCPICGRWLTLHLSDVLRAEAL